MLIPASAGARVQHTGRGAGVLLIAVPVAFMVFFTALQVSFDYPDILRRPAAEVLSRFAVQRGALVPLWYGMLASALLFIPMSVAVALRCGRSCGVSIGLATSGVLAGLVQSVGLARWVFAVPPLAEKHAAATGEHEKFAVEVVFDTLNSLLGVGIGEHLGYLFTATWTMMLVWIVRPVRPVTAGVGAVAGVAIAAGLLEGAGLEVAATINALGYTLWAGWLVWLGLLSLWAKPVFAAQ